MLGNLIGGFVTILVGVSLFPAVANEISAARFNQLGDNNVTGVNVTGAASTITGLVPLFFALAIATAGVGVAVQGLKAAGIMDI